MHHIMNKMRENQCMNQTFYPNFFFPSCLRSNLPGHRSKRTPISLFPLVATLHNYIKLNSSSLSSPDTLPLFLSLIAWNPLLLVKMNDFWPLCCCQNSVSVKVPWLILSLKYSCFYLSHLSCPSPDGWCSSWILCTHQPSCCSSRCKYPQSCHLMPQPNTCLLL